jgi:prolipoprotein diacylglyceryltransferase
MEVVALIAVALPGLWRLNPPPGRLMAAFVVLYSVKRLWLDFFRADAPVLAVGLTAAQWIAIGILIGAAFLTVVMWTKRGVTRNATSVHT